ncbi:MAG: hypothetical protein COC09_02875 [Gammaproteobacteria bacterium]|nr:hypothetical protein [Gammaproteobacteria bacterium]PCH64363.1 MAG: hypothetical protein COC09_02875 [Gammaproteobacteria bacterium]
MSDNNNNTGFGDRAQEMLMLDMLDGMHEFFTQTAYHSSLANSFEILRAKEKVNGEHNNQAEKTALSQECGAVIISFSEARARRAMRQDPYGKDIIAQRSLSKP